jgi:hypothetical protein
MNRRLVIASGIVLFGFFILVTSQAQEQSAEELQRIREQRLLEWHAHQQARQNFEQNTSIDQPYQQQSNAREVAPEAEDLFSAAINGNVAQIDRSLSMGLDVNVSNSERETALHMAGGSQGAIFSGDLSG